MYVVRGREALPLNSLETSVILILRLYLKSNRQIDPLASRYCILGRSEKPKSWKSKNGQADYLPRHSPDVRTVFEI